MAAVASASVSSSSAAAAAAAASASGAGSVSGAGFPSAAFFALGAAGFGFDAACAAVPAFFAASFVAAA